MSEVRREVEVDTELGEIYTAEMIAARRLDQLAGNIHRMSGSPEQVRYYGRQRVTTYERDLEEAIAAGPQHAWDQSSWDRQTAERDDLLIEADKLHARKYELDAEYRQSFWNRFFIVQDGHIHSSMNCSTCNNGQSATMFGWLPQLSGLTEKDAVEAHGALLCTVCFPSAPVEWTNQHEVDEAAKAAASCPGSGEFATFTEDERRRNIGRRTGYKVCPHCGEMVSYTTTGKFRKHKKGTAK